jgi:hypothetical protein
MSSLDMSADLAKNPWTLNDKVLYGGLGYGAFSLPSNFFKIIICVLFPPLAQVINILGNTITTTFPFTTWESFKLLFTPDNFQKLIYSFMLTTFFYIPGLVYVLGNIVDTDLKKNNKSK